MNTLFLICFVKLCCFVTINASDGWNYWGNQNPGYYEDVGSPFESPNVRRNDNYDDEEDSSQEYEGSQGYPNRRGPSRQTPVFGWQNPYFFGQRRQGQPNRRVFQNVPDETRGSPRGGQCSSLTSFPPDSHTGCCGVDPSDADRIIGGKHTEIDQYPWLVLLKTKFNYGAREAVFNCGGSLISARYVLTAAHCVHEDGARVTDIEVTLAEFDKRTFPNDCVNSYEGRRCVQNVIVHAENVLPHPQYEDSGLQNDVALVRLRERVPYTEFIRPICLTPINIDSQELRNTPLSIAGWGRNGQYNSNVKQFAVVHLVPQRECKTAYPQLTLRHVCAAGKTGQDTCKGDSGGPLMILYEAKYFIAGIVSGKRSDAPCGTSVPSLYTNVYHYLDWIKSNIEQ